MTTLSHQTVDASGEVSPATSSTIDLPIGAHLVTQRRGYEHHGIYVGSGRVVHYAGFAGCSHRGPVEEVELARFLAGCPLSIRSTPGARYAGDEAVRRARSRLGENRYRLLTNNCEHFCAWCLLGESRSEQVYCCLRHPRAGVHALVCLVRAFVESGAKSGEVCRTTGVNTPGFKENMMVAAEKTLHWAVDKWLAPTPSMPARVVQFCHRGSQQQRYVCVEALRPGGRLSIFFFRHNDGSWNVFPPPIERPAMNGYRRALLC